MRLPRLEPGEVNRSDTVLTHAAGKGVNVAQVLADLGHQVTVGGFLGEDNPQAFEALIARRGFADAFYPRPRRNPQRYQDCRAGRPGHRHQRARAAGQ